MPNKKQPPPPEPRHLRSSGPPPAHQDVMEIEKANRLRLCEQSGSSTSSFSIIPSNPSTGASSEASVSPVDKPDPTTQGQQEKEETPPSLAECEGESSFHSAHNSQTLRDSSNPAYESIISGGGERVIENAAGDQGHAVVAKLR
ncbi:unnamed protein product [Allacma fusca]|uniref:Uncharacterized protein n=1 Tax=Allacma fusca TaxID=39272 RepID=A0A8J2KK54_9HEXA|nr:unnamed protein product [Allacma fusca]